MFLGIFSSILPYLIAAGIYLVWMIFSMVQPLLEKRSEADLPEDAFTIEVSEESAPVLNNFCYYEDYFSSDQDAEAGLGSKLTPTLHRSDAKIKPSYAHVFWKSPEFLRVCYSRPPPALI